MHPDLIAPCGMNCRLCRAYDRKKNPCPGCYERDDLPSIAAARCRIRNCEPVKAGTVRYCFECDQYPCAALNHLDKRYRKNYGMSMIDNLRMIKHSGIEGFIQREKERWTCSKCGETICVHKETCLVCGQSWR